MANEVFNGDALGVNEAMVPDGWDGTTDLFTPAGELNTDAFSQDAVEEAPPEPSKPMSDDEYLRSLITDDEVTADAAKADDGREAEPDGAKQTEPKSRTLKLKVNHQEETLDIDSMSDEDLTALLQKGRAFEARQEQDRKQEYKKVYQQQLDAGMTEEAAQLIAERKIGKSYDLNEPEEDTLEEPAKETAPTFEKPGNREEEIRYFKELYPEVKQIPNEVARAFSEGKSIIKAYADYVEAQSKDAAAKLQKENKILKQNASAASRAPVSGVSGGGDTTPRKISDFEKGFDSDPW